MSMYFLLPVKENDTFKKWNSSSNKFIDHYQWLLEKNDKFSNSELYFEFQCILNLSMIA